LGQNSKTGVVCGLLLGLFGLFDFTSQMGESLQFKIVLLGEGCVGKTSLSLRYVQDQFNPQHKQTQVATFLTKKLAIDGKRVNLAIWDTAGQEKFHSLGPIYYRDANGALLVYDITDNDSFSKVKNWVKELRKMLGNEIVLAIAGNKCDLEKNRVVSEEEALSYAAKVKARHFNTSAKLNKGVEEVFLDLTKRLLEKAATGNIGASPLTINHNGLILASDKDSPSPVAQGGSCCT